MVREKYSNSAITTLDGGIDGSTTTVVVDDASTFPLINFRIIIESEIMFCTSRASETLTVIRGIEGTAGASHSDGVDVASIWTAGAFDQYRLDLLAATGVVPRHTSVSADDDEFDDETFSGWTKVWHGTTPVVTEVEQDHSLSLHMASGGSAAQLTAYLKAKSPSPGDWITMGFSMFGTTNQFPICGMMFANGATYGAGVQVVNYFSPNERVQSIAAFSNFTARTANEPLSWVDNAFAGVYHLKMEYLGSNQWHTYSSTDGIQWAQVKTSQTMGSMTPTHMGFFMTHWGSGFPFVFNIKYIRFSF